MLSLLIFAYSKSTFILEINKKRLSFSNRKNYSQKFESILFSALYQYWIGLSNLY